MFIILIYTRPYLIDAKEVLSGRCLTGELEDELSSEGQ